MPEHPDRHTSRPRPALRGAMALVGCLLAATATAACGTAGAQSPKDGTARAVVATAPADPRPTADTDRKAPARIITRKAGDPFPGLFAHLPGTLVVTEDNCVAVKASKSAELTPIVWGHGWSVREENGGTAVYDAAGKLFAREGDRVGLGGGTSERFAGHPCVTGLVFEANDAQKAP
ncbi:MULTISPECIES: hypothetical protein [Streptomyces]|uniref:Lipoprotein n=1 Tax=Streptomyces venezuelae TaxID=54571 RepID=A0A5P2AUG9_STRVZ|nr:hypothetical protein [Streptomyces venezuelae]QES20541.1 hypothetical protein DEJ46_16585 [Streptomyces venezuelae]